MTLRIHRTPNSDTAIIATDNVRAEESHPRHKDPTPEEIVERAAEIRANWSEHQWCVRAGHLPGGIEVMVIDTSAFGAAVKASSD